MTKNKPHAKPKKHAPAPKKKPVPSHQPTVPPVAPEAPKAPEPEKEPEPVPVDPADREAQIDAAYDRAPQKLDAPVWPTEIELPAADPVAPPPHPKRGFFDRMFHGK